MSTFLSTFVRLLAETGNNTSGTNTTTTTTEGASYNLPEGWEWVGQIIDVLNVVLVPILILVGTAGMIYAVVLGVKLARAETADQREEAKKKIINAIIALVVIIALILLLKIFITEFPNWIKPGE